MSSTAGPVPPGQHAPFATTTPKDHEASILIATAFGLACILFFTGIRVVVRTTISHGIGFDDYAYYIAALLAFIQSAIVLGACSKGLGKALDLVPLDNQDSVQAMYYASNLFFIVVIGLSKVSVISFMHRISRMKQHRLVFTIAMGLVGVWTVASLFAVALQCDLSQAWLTVGRQCPGVLTRWQVIGAFDILSEIAIVGLVAYLVYALQTSVGSKATVVAIFSVRLFLIVFIAFRIHTFSQSEYTRNPFLHESNFTVWTQSEMTYSLISATVPIFHNFLKSLSTGFGGIAGAGTNGYGYGSTSRSQVHNVSGSRFEMSKLRSGKNKGIGLSSKLRGRGTNTDEEDEDYDAKNMSVEQQFGARPTASTVVQWGGDVRNDSRGPALGRANSINSDESQRYMIRKDMQWDVRHEPRE